LIGIRFPEHRMQGGYDWHLETTKQTQDVTTSRPSEDSVLVLQAY